MKDRVQFAMTTVDGGDSNCHTQKSQTNRLTFKTRRFLFYLTFNDRFNDSVLEH